MKRLHVAVALALVAIFALSGVVADAAQGGNQPGKLVFNMNVIGRPNDYNGNGALNGDRHTLFIPLKTDNYVDPCTTTGGQNNPDVTQVPAKGVKLNIVAGPDFAILDGDATDKTGTLQAVQSTGQYQVFAEARGKPGGCLDLEGYVYEDTLTGSELVFLGSFDVDRSTGKPGSINISNILYPNGVDLFADPYSGLFWQLYNNGLRVMNIRIYETAQ